MNIEAGKFYANSHDDYRNLETNIILVLPDEESTLKPLIASETMFILNDEVQDIYKSNWSPEFFEREATEEEINLFKKNRENKNQLKTYGWTVFSELQK